MNSTYWLGNRTNARCLLAVAFLSTVEVNAEGNDQPEPPAIATEQFAKLHSLIRPQPGELRFHEIPWQIDVWEARKKAAAEGKPILVWSGAGGAPIGVC